jgi:hypothetical protein
MTQSAEDSARAILRIFSSEDIRAGHVLMYELVNLQFLKSCSAEDFAAGLAYAIEKEWLSNENTMIRLTKPRFDESQPEPWPPIILRYLTPRRSVILVRVVRARQTHGQYRHGERTKAAIAEKRKFRALLCWPDLVNHDSGACRLCQTSR